MLSDDFAEFNCEQESLAKKNDENGKQRKKFENVDKKCTKGNKKNREDWGINKSPRIRNKGTKKQNQRKIK